MFSYAELNGWPFHLNYSYDLRKHPTREFQAEDDSSLIGEFALVFVILDSYCVKNLKIRPNVFNKLDMPKQGCYDDPKL
jgi:hypothetical protein